ncbi:unnamed protein product [Soboliphyme baturini]|uniref:Ig-like domain-containing protein n=1 Tax=Soboliphyme baturini TaxID=241478 RepID=A0A183J2G0_9BILA|nr:unnamed protein product [Soboliphyme baturini]
MSNVTIMLLDALNCLTLSFSEITRIQRGRTWTFTCPDVDEYERFIVTWTLDNAIWLKMDNGIPKITQKLTSQLETTEQRPHVVHVTANDCRYHFYYDDEKPEFRMEIIDAREEDSGVWACYLALYKTEGQATELLIDYNLVVGNYNPMIFIDDVEDALKPATEVLISTINSTATMLRLRNHPVKSSYYRFELNRKSVSVHTSKERILRDGSIKIQSTRNKNHGKYGTRNENTNV